MEGEKLGRRVDGGAAADEELVQGVLIHQLRIRARLRIRNMASEEPRGVRFRYTRCATHPTTRQQSVAAVKDVTFSHLYG
jgi:hypothetical protein